MFIALPVVSFDQIPGEHLIGTNTAVVGTLWWGETTWGPSEGPQVGIQQDVLLLDTEPRLFLLALIVCLLTRDAVIGLCAAK